MQIFKIRVDICYTEELQDLEISATNMMVVSIQCEISHENFLYNCFNKAFVKMLTVKLTF